MCKTSSMGKRSRQAIPQYAPLSCSSSVPSRQSFDNDCGDDFVCAPESEQSAVFSVSTAAAATGAALTAAVTVAADSSSEVQYPVWPGTPLACVDANRIYYPTPCRTKSWLTTHARKQLQRLWRLWLTRVRPGRMWRGAQAMA
jgi:hypothetical protein